MAMSKKSKQKQAESLLRLRDGQQQEFSLAIVSRRTLRDEAMLIIPDVQVYPCGCVFLLCQCGSRAPEPEFSESQRASIDLGPSASGCVYRGFNQLCMVTAYHQFDSPSLLPFYEQQTRACGLLHHPRCLVFWSKLSSEQGRQRAARVCLPVSSVTLNFCKVCSCLVCFPSLQTLQAL